MSESTKTETRSAEIGSDIPRHGLVRFLTSRNISLAIFDGVNRCTFCSRPLLDLIGDAPSTLFNLVDKLTSDSNVRASLQENLQATMGGQETADWPIEFCRVPKEGHPKTYSVGAIPPDRETGSGLIVVVDDVTSEKSFLKDLEQLGRLATVGQITAGVAHELNNILTSILGWTQIGHQNANSESTTTSSLEIIDGNARRARDIASKLLDMSKEGSDPLRPVSIVKIVEEVLKLLSWEMTSARIQVVQFFDTEEHIWGDENSLSQVFINIIRNAMDAMPDGGTLQVLVSKKDTQVETVIADTGPGIDDEIIGRVFNPFFSTKQRSDSSTHGGTGLGLAICRDIIEKLSGHIEVTSEPGRGTRFTISLPITAEAAAKVEDTPGPRMSIPPGTAVLVADDEPDVGEMVRTVLELKGAVVFVAVNGSEAVELCRNHRFDAAFVDFSMPGLSGHNLGREMLAISPDLPIIFMSGREVDVRKDMPIADFLKKPFDLDDIQIKLRSVLKGDLPD